VMKVVVCWGLGQNLVKLKTMNGFKKHKKKQKQIHPHTQHNTYLS